MISYRNGNTVPRKVLLAVALVIMILGTTGCVEDPVGTGSGSGSSGNTTPDCEKYETARATFKNGSSRSTYAVVLDGSRICTLGPGESHTRTVAAGRHSVQFKFANSGKPACSTGYPTLAICDCRVFTCRCDY
jgi:hypothetical protein